MSGPSSASLPSLCMKLTKAHCGLECSLCVPLPDFTHASELGLLVGSPGGLSLSPSPMSHMHVGVEGTGFAGLSRWLEQRGVWGQEAPQPSLPNIGLPVCLSLYQEGGGSPEPLCSTSAHSSHLPEGVTGPHVAAKEAGRAGNRIAATGSDRSRGDTAPHKARGERDGCQGGSQ